MDALGKRQEVTAQNLANVSTTGFKRGVAANRAFDQTLGLVQAEGGLDLTPGDLVETGRQLDLAIEGPGFLVVQTPAGERYTRAGQLTVDGEGALVTPQGHRVLGENGPLILGLTGGVAAEQVAIGQDGQVLMGQTPLGRLRLADLSTSRTPAQAEGNGLYKAAPDPEVRPAGSIRQGHLERSNSEPVSELVGLITIQRSFEAAGRAIDATLRTLERTTTELR